MLTSVHESCVRMLRVQKTNEINIREARPLLSKLTDDVVLTDGYYIITVRDKPKSILVKYDEKLIQLLDDSTP